MQKQKIFQPKVFAIIAVVLFVLTFVSTIPQANQAFAVGNQFNVAQIIKRPVIARLWDQDQYVVWTLTRSNETPASIGKATGLLDPTWVSEVFYIGAPDGTGKLTQSQIAAFNTFKDAVRKYAPHCVFDVMISEATGSGGTPRDPVPIMKTVNSEIKIQGFSFDYWWNLKDFPHMYEGVINYAHSQGQFIAGAAIHELSDVYPGEDIALSGIPSNLTTITLQDANFVKSVHSKFGANFPVVFHIASNPLDANGQYWFHITTAQRMAEVTTQVVSIFKLGAGVAYLYSIANPQYPNNVSYDANHDGKMMMHIYDLMNRFA